MSGRVGGLHLDQAPPLAIPAAFFLAACLGVCVAGALLAVVGASAFATPWAPSTLALVHLGTLGFLAMTMMGALYQLIPVVAGTSVPAVRAAYGVHAAFVVGVVALVARFLGAPAFSAHVAVGALGLALAGFLAPVAVALVRAPVRTPTVWGMRLAATSLALALGLGLRMALGYAGLGFPASRALWIEVHLCLGLLGWVGGLITAVSWQIVPMFHLTPPLSRRATEAALGLLAVGLVGPLVVLALDGTPTAAAASALPAAAAVWVVTPVTVLRAIRARKRRIVDGSLRFWVLAMVTAPLLVPLAATATLAPDPRWRVAFGWLALWGWAGTVIHGTVVRIVPFLIWFHRFSRLAGTPGNPSMRDLLPDARVRTGWWLHVGTTGMGLFAIGSGADVAARIAGVGLVVTGAWLGWHLARALARRPGTAGAPVEPRHWAARTD